MSGIGFWEFIFLCMIGLIVLGPKRLPAVANQLGSWVGQARRMTRTLRRQLEEELDLDKELNIRPKITPFDHPPPRDDDSYSPLHGDAATESGVTVRASDPASDTDLPGKTSTTETSDKDEAPTSGDDEAKREG